MRARASWIGHLSSKWAITCVENNTNVVRTVVCYNNVAFVVSIDIGYCCRNWTRGRWIGRFSSKRAIACVKKNTNVVRIVFHENNVGFAVAIDIGCCHMIWVRARISWIGHLSSKRAATCVEENTDVVRIVVCYNNVRFAVSIDIDCCHRTWARARASWIGHLSSKRTITCVEENTDVSRIVVCYNNVEFGVSINIGCCHRIWARARASWIGHLISKCAITCVEKNTDVVRAVVCDNNVGFAIPIDIGCCHIPRSRASWIGHLISKCTITGVEKNTNVVRTDVCYNNVRFVIPIDIGCCHRIWARASWIGHLISKYAITCVEENTDVVPTVVCYNNVGFAVSIDIGYCDRLRCRVIASLIDYLSWKPIAWSWYETKIVISACVLMKKNFLI